jgi:hypothetical protein
MDMNSPGSASIAPGATPPATTWADVLWQRGSSRAEVMSMTAEHNGRGRPHRRPVDRYLEAIVGASIADCDVLDPAITLDATVPNWRMQIRGDAAVRAELSRWYADVGHFDELTRTSLPTGELVEFTLRWEEAGIPHAAHQVHIVEVAGDSVIGDRVWCGGRWPASLLTEMGQESDDPS